MGHKDSRMGWRGHATEGTPLQRQEDAGHHYTLNSHRVLAEIHTNKVAKSLQRPSWFLRAAGVKEGEFSNGIPQGQQGRRRTESRAWRFGR